jgi:hypothetical protein
MGHLVDWCLAAGLQPASLSSQVQRAATGEPSLPCRPSVPYWNLAGFDAAVDLSLDTYNLTLACLACQG